jgi:DNA-binding MarR family transcriptional regulator
MTEIMPDFMTRYTFNLVKEWPPPAQEMTTMGRGPTVEAIRDFLGSGHIFTSAVDELMQEQLRAVSDASVTVAQLRLLLFVSRTHSQTLHAVARFLGVSDAAASKGVDRLVRSDLLRRVEAPLDRRAIHLSLTEGGRRLMKRFRAARNRALTTLFREYSGGDLRRISDQLDHLSATIIVREEDRETICSRCGIYFRSRCLLRERENRTCAFHLSRRDSHEPIVLAPDVVSNDAAFGSRKEADHDETHNQN